MGKKSKPQPDADDTGTPKPESLALMLLMFSLGFTLGVSMVRRAEDASG